jgi:curli production assembly/transport component CsgE
MFRLLATKCLAMAALAAISAATASTARAGETATPGALNATATLDEQFGGIVTDQTITSAGQDFYQYFSVLWHDKPMSQQFAIAIRERLSARQGNRIQIEFANRTVFEAVLPAARGNIRALSENAVEVAYEAVARSAAARLLLSDADLARDEL